MLFQRVLILNPRIPRGSFQSRFESAGVLSKLSEIADTTSSATVSPAIALLPPVLLWFKAKR